MLVIELPGGAAKEKPPPVYKRYANTYEIAEIDNRRAELFRTYGDVKIWLDQIL